MLSRLLSLQLSLFGVLAIQKDLTDSNFDKEIDGKNALLWFLAPW
jgi:hypothetical protein